jgi:serine/threonine protein kinase
MSEGERSFIDTLARVPPTDGRQAPASAFAPGDPLPNLEMWTLERRLGGGGFGEVWLARHPRKGAAAVKFCTDPTARHQLVTHEKAVVARVMRHSGDHPNVVPLLECNLTGDIPWLMYEFVEGGTLAESIAAWRTLSPPQRLGKAVRVLHALAGALAAFHRLRPPLVHRDMKPQNVLMAGNTPRITDFGVGGAAVEAGRSDPSLTGSAPATVPEILRAAASSRYAPPEQRFGSPPDPRDDVYALGVVAYQLLHGSTEADPGADAERELRAMRVPAELASLVVESLALDPQRRPKDAGAWESRLAALLKRKTAASRVPAARGAGPNSNNDLTEQADALTDSDLAVGVSQTLAIAARGRWYSRSTSAPDADWQMVATTPAEVRVSPGEEYRFSVHSGATEEVAQAIGGLAGLKSLAYLNLSYCAGVTDAGLAHLPAFPGLRHLYLRGCEAVTDAGLLHLRALANLQTLELSDCPRLTIAAVEELRAALPRCKVLR